MATYRNQHHRLTHRGRAFHFISYQATAAQPARQIEARPDTWFLVSANHRWAAIPQVPGRNVDELEARLVEWLESEVFA